MHSDKCCRINSFLIGSKWPFDCHSAVQIVANGDDISRQCSFCTARVHRRTKDTARERDDSISILTIYASEQEERKTDGRRQCLDPSLSLFIHCQVSFDGDAFNSFVFSVESHHAESNGAEDTLRTSSEAYPGMRCSRCTGQRASTLLLLLRADVL